MSEMQKTFEREVPGRGGAAAKKQVLQVITIELNGGGFVSLVRRKKAKSSGWRSKPLARRTAPDERAARINHTELCAEFGAPTKKVRGE